MSVIHVSDTERACLASIAQHYFSEVYCPYLRTIAAETGLTIPQVRRSVRSLARKGLAIYVRGLFDDDGNVAGSGYCATREGYELNNFLDTAEIERQDRKKGIT